MGVEFLMLGIDCETGEIVWEVENPDGWVNNSSGSITRPPMPVRSFLSE